MWKFIEKTQPHQIWQKVNVWSQFGTEKGLFELVEKAPLAFGQEWGGGLQQEGKLPCSTASYYKLIPQKYLLHMPKLILFQDHHIKMCSPFDFSCQLLFFPIRFFQHHLFGPYATMYVYHDFEGIITCLAVVEEHDTLISCCRVSPHTLNKKLFQPPCMPECLCKALKSHKDRLTKHVSHATFICDIGDFSPYLSHD